MLCFGNSTIKNHQHFLHSMCYDFKIFYIRNKGKIPFNGNTQLNSGLLTKERLIHCFKNKLINTNLYEVSPFDPDYFKSKLQICISNQSDVKVSSGEIQNIYDKIPWENSSLKESFESILAKLIFQTLRTKLRSCSVELCNGIVDVFMPFAILSYFTEPQREESKSSKFHLL